MRPSKVIPTPRPPLAWLVALGMLATAAQAQDIQGELSHEAEEKIADLDELRQIAELVRDARWDTGRAAKVSGFTLSRDTGSVVLEDGYVFLQEPVKGLISQARFYGDARFQLRPPLAMERDQVQRFFGTDQIDQALEQVTFSFTGWDDQQLFESLEYSEAAAAEAREAEKEIADWMEAQAKEDKNVDREEEARRQFAAHQRALGLYDRLLDINQQGSLAVSMSVKLPDGTDMSRSHMDRLQWIFSPDDYEETSVSARYDHGKRKYWSLVTRCATSDQYKGRYKYAATSPRLESKVTAPILLKKDRLVLDIDPSSKYDIRQRADMEVEVLEDGLKLMYFGVTPYLGVTGVRLDGEPVDFLQPAIPDQPHLHTPQITVLLPRPLKSGETVRVEMDLEGNILDKLDGFSFFIRETDRWFPNTGQGPRHPAYFDTTMLLPKKFTGVSNGEPKECRTEDTDSEKECFRFVTRHPISFPFFNLGKNVRVDRGIAPDSQQTPIEVYTVPESLFEFRTYDGITGPKTRQFNLSKTGPALVNKARVALAVYEEWFGPFPYAKLALTPHERGVGRGAASMLLLWKFAFLSTTDGSQVWGRYTSEPWWVDAFVAHETAHQWWGNIAGIREDRDQWFSEGFADYGSLIYLEYVDLANGTQWRRKELENWHEKLMREDGYMHTVAPVALGNRVNSSENRRGFENMRQDYMYNKGGFIMHMLRTLARQQTGDDKRGDDLFKKAVRSFIDEHYLGAPSNLDMQKSFSASYGTDLAWFFRQWVYGTGVPKLKFSYELDKGPEGPLLRGRIVQKDTDFKFPIAVTFLRGKGKKADEAHYYQWIEQGDQTFEFGPLPWRPDEVELNKDLGLLCSIDEVPWEQVAGQ